MCKIHPRKTWKPSSPLLLPVAVSSAAGESDEPAPPAAEAAAAAGRHGGSKTPSPDCHADSCPDLPCVTPRWCHLPQRLLGEHKSMADKPMDFQYIYIICTYVSPWNSEGYMQHIDFKYSHRSTYILHITLAFRGLHSTCLLISMYE